MALLLDLAEYEGKALKWYQGRAYRRPDVAATVVYPVPLNWFARWGRTVWFRLRGGRQWATRFELRALDAWRTGYERGQEAGGREALARADFAALFQAGYEAHGAVLTAQLDGERDEDVLRQMVNNRRAAAVKKATEK